MIEIQFTDFGKVNRLVELKKERVLIGDGILPLARGGNQAPMGETSLSEYGRYLRENLRKQKDLECEMTPCEIRVAEKMYIDWFVSYLRDD